MYMFFCHSATVYVGDMRAFMPKQIISFIEHQKIILYRMVLPGFLSFASIQKAICVLNPV